MISAKLHPLKINYNLWQQYSNKNCSSAKNQFWRTCRKFKNNFYSKSLKLIIMELIKWRIELLWHHATV